MAGNTTDPGRSVASKVIAILKIFNNGSAFSLSEIARLTGLPVSTAHRLVAELMTSGMLERTRQGDFQVGMQMRGLAGQAGFLPPSFRDRGRRVLDDLAAAWGAGVVRLGMLDGHGVAFMERPAGNSSGPADYRSGTLPAHATAMGRALLAFAAPRVVETVFAQQLTAYTPYTCVRPERLRRALAVIRLTRVAVCRREYDLDTSAVAVPVFGPGGAVVAALEASVRHGHNLSMAQPPLIMAGRTLTRELQGGQAAGQLATPVAMSAR
jgi:DNA-binding IclR family transcriptional regulator